MFPCLLCLFAALAADVRCPVLACMQMWAMSPPHLSFQLDCIPDTEDLEGQLDDEGGPGTRPLGPSPGQQQLQSEQRQEPIAGETAAAAPVSCLPNGCSSSHTGSTRTSVDMTAAANIWPVGAGTCSSRASWDLQRQCMPASGSSRVSCDLQQQHTPANVSSRASSDLQRQQQAPDIEKGCS